MANTYTKLLAAIAAAAFLTATPVYAQNTSGSVGGGAADVYPSQDLDTRVNPLKQQMGETFRGLASPPVATDVAVEAKIGAAVPEGVVLGPVPAEIVAVAPETEGYEYFTLPDGRIVIVHPAERTIATIIE
jgi:hypothetical protein